MRLIRFMSTDRWTVALVLVVAATHVLLPSKRNENYRIKHMLPAGWRIARGVGVMRTVREARLGDDPGMALLLGLVLRATPARGAPDAAQPEEPLRLYEVLLAVVDAGFLLLLYAALAVLLSRPHAFGLCMIYLLGGNVRFVAFSGDVYMFTVYAATLLLAAMALVGRPGRLAAALLVPCVVGITVCNLFRSGSALVAFGFLLLLIWPIGLVQASVVRRARLRAGACLLGTILAVGLSHRVFGGTRHVVWHSLHCGLMEFGGFQDRNHRLYPAFVPPGEVPPDARPIEQWSDHLEFQLARQIDPAVVPCTPQYEAIVRADLVRLCADHPAGVVRLLARRLWRWSCLNPWQKHDAGSLIRDHWTDTVWRLFWAVVWIGGLSVGLPRRAVFLCLAIAPMALPPLLVHSGYLMYNVGGRLPLYLFSVCAAAAVIGAALQHRPDLASKRMELACRRGCRKCAAKPALHRR